MSGPICMIPLGWPGGLVLGRDNCSKAGVVPGRRSMHFPDRRCPVFERIVVPLDGSELAERALPAAEDLARLTGAPLHLVRIVEMSRLDRYGPYGLAATRAAFETVVEEEEAMAQDYLAAVARYLVAAGLPTTAEARHGGVVRELIGLTQPGDVIVMASHGRGGLTRLFLGSVAEEVVRHATVPVLLVRVRAADTAPLAIATAAEPMVGSATAG
jgi:nucleotide-binding universal stress UspA family protein